MDDGCRGAFVKTWLTPETAVPAALGAFGDERNSIYFP